MWGPRRYDSVQSSIIGTDGVGLDCRMVVIGRSTEGQQAAEVLFGSEGPRRISRGFPILRTFHQNLGLICGDTERK